MRRRTFLLSALATAVATPAHALETLDGDAVLARVKRARDAVLVHVWATWCPSCRTVFDEVNEAAADFGARGLTVLAFAVNRDVAAVERFHQERPPRWVGHHVRNGEGIAQAVASLGGRYPSSIPYDLLLDGTGRVIAQWTGGIGRQRLREVIAAALPDAPSAAPVAPVEQGRVRIVLAGREGDPVWIDGWNAGVLPLETELVGGAHQFRVEGAAGRFEVERAVLLAAGRVIEVDLGTAPSAVAPP